MTQQTPQQRADELLHLWRIQRQLGIPANDRRFTIADDYERELGAVREAMERV